MRELLPHQQDIINITKDKDRYAIYASPGTGKTTMSLYDWYHNSGKDNVIVLTKPSLVKQWVEEGVAEMGFEDVVGLALNKGSKTSMEQMIKSVQENKKGVYVVSYSSAKLMEGLLNFDKKNTALIFDESHLAKNKTSKQSKFCVKLANKYEWIRLLTGTPLSIGWEDYYIPLKLLGEKDPMVKTVKAYEENFQIIERKTNFSSRSTYATTIGYKNIDTLKEIINRTAIYVDEKKAGIRLPDQIERTYYVEPAKEQKQALKDKKFRNWMLKNSGSKMMAYRTSASGFLYGEDMYGERIVEQFEEQNKKETLKNLIEGIDGKILVFYNFTQELEDIKDVVSKTGKTLSIITKNDIDTSGDIVATHFVTGSTGLNLQMINHTVFYSPTIVGSEYQQSLKRTHRIGQNETCYYYNIITKDSIEERILAKVKQNEAYTKEMFEEEYGEDNEEVF